VRPRLCSQTGRKHVAKADPNNSTAAQLTVQTLSAPGSFLEFLGLDERDINRRQAYRWRLARIVRFADRQKKQRAWIQFSELAERHRRNIGIDEGYEQLKRAVINGEFERNGRSRVLYLHPAVTTAKMTREKMRNAVETHPPETVRRHYLAPCWIPRELADTTGQATKRKGGRCKCDDTVALDEMYRLVSQQGYSCRQAAEQVVVQGLALGDGGNASTVDRIRRKFAKKFREMSAATGKV